MKAKTILLFLFATTLFMARAQDYDAINRYMAEYSGCWNRHAKASGSDGIIGKKMPEFYFDKQLNSKALRAKTVVMTFWATWCGGCRLLCVDLDSVLCRNSDEYKDVQVIGVDADEKLTNKGYIPSTFWKEKRISYPTTKPGKAADECGKSIKAGHPSTIVIDKGGIVRGRWDALSPGVAGDVALMVWAMDIAPGQGIKADVASVKECLDNGHYDRALLLLSQMPEDSVTEPMRWEALVHVSSLTANDKINALRKQAEKEKDTMRIAWNWRPTPEYVSTMKAFRDAVYGDSTITYTGLLRNGSYAAGIVANWARPATTRDRLISVEMELRQGIAIQKQALASLREMRQSPAYNDLPAEDKHLIEAAVAKYGSKVFADDNSAHDRMLQDEKEEAEHMARLKTN